MNKKHFLLQLSLILFLTQCAYHKPRPGLIIPNSIESKEFKNIRVALVLGGGGSRGIAQIGAIEVLEENNIPIDLIVGSSAGSAVAALYADTKSAAKVKNILFKARTNQLLDFSLADSIKMFTNLSYPVKGQAYENFMFDNLTAKSFSELKIPVSIVTVDAITGKKFVINDGPIAPAIRASSAVPPIISPVSIYNRTLFDGAILEPVPVATAKIYNPKLTIAIDITAPPEKKRPANFIDLTYKAMWLSYYELSRTQAAMADVAIYPDLLGHGMLEDHRKEELYQLGRQAAIKALPQIKQKLRKLHIKNK